MIDRRARNKLAEEIRHFVAGLTDNLVFDERVFNIQTKDVGVLNIRHQMWLIYDDFARHKLKGKWSLSTEDRAIVLRCILFLKSDTEYRWPNRNHFLKALSGLLTFGLATVLFEKEAKNRGAWEVWPFLTREEFETVNSLVGCISCTENGA